MKQIYLTLLLALLSTLGAQANEYATIDGIRYELDENTNEATVTSNSPTFSGSITIPSTITYNSKTYRVTAIGNSAFKGYNGLTSVTIPKTVKSIDDDAFYGCESLKDVYSEIEEPFAIGYEVFCTSYSFYLGQENVIINYYDATLHVPYGTRSKYKATEGWEKNFKTIVENTYVSNGICYELNNSNMTAEVIKNEANQYSGAITIPASVEYNGKTYSVTTIGDWAFTGCKDLTSITIPNSVTTIGSYAFGGCRGLTSITIPNSVEIISKSAFEGCRGFTSLTIPNSVKSIYDSAFDDCRGLNSVTIGNGVTFMGKTVFGGCSSLSSIIVQNGNTKYDSRDDCNAIIEKATNSLVLGCKNTVIPNSVTTIGESSFYKCSGLTSIIIPNSVTEIGNGSFQECI